MKSIEGQMDIFSFLTPEPDDQMIKSVPTITPFEKGIILYEVKLDTVKAYRIQHAFELKTGGTISYGYHVYDLDAPEMGTTLLHRNLGISVFVDKIDAERLAHKNSIGIVKYTVNDLMRNVLEIKSYATLCMRMPKSWVTAKTIALTKYGVYVKDYHSYPFLHIYHDVEAAKKVYERMCTKTLYSSKPNEYVREISINFEFEDMYRCTDSKYSSLIYTCENGDPYVRTKK